MSDPNPPQVCTNVCTMQKTYEIKQGKNWDDLLYNYCITKCTQKPQVYVCVENTPGVNENNVNYVMLECVMKDANITK